MAKRITFPVAEALTCPPNVRHFEIQDSGLEGFGLRVSRATGKKYWWLRLVDPATNKRRRVTIGRYPEVGVALAREIAREKIIESRTGLAAKQGTSVFELAKLFMHRHVEPKLKPRTVHEYRRIINTYVLPAWGKLDVGDIDVRSAADFLDSIARRAPVMANRVRAVLSKMWVFAKSQGMALSNPIKDTEKPAYERERDRWLEPAEIQAVMLHWDAERSPGAGALLVQLATGQRISEILGMDFEQITDELWWNTPTKTASRHRVYVGGRIVQEVLGRMRAWWGGSGPVFRTMAPGRQGQRLATIRRAVDRTREATGITDWSSHVLRHTVKTGLSELKVPEVTKDLILGHRRRGTGARYDHHTYADEIREAMVAWDARLGAIKHRRL